MTTDLLPYDDLPQPTSLETRVIQQAAHDLQRQSARNGQPATLEEMTEALEQQVAVIRSGDMQPMETLLIAQANTLTGFAGELWDIAMHRLRQPLHEYSTRDDRAERQDAQLTLKLAIRTDALRLENVRTLALLRRPSAPSMEQINIANHQQVNNVLAQPPLETKIVPTQQSLEDEYA